MMVRLSIRVTYLNIQACQQLLDASAFSIPLLARIQALDSIWVRQGTSVGAFCKGAACANSVSFSVTCNPTTAGRRKRQAALNNAQVDIGINNVDAQIQNRNDGTLLSPKEVVTADVLDNNGFNLNATVPNGVPDEPSLSVTESSICDAGQALVGTECVDCAAGTRYDNASSSCVVCAVGEYQDLTKQTSCKQCTAGLTTELTGSQAATDCFTSCAIGSYYNKASGSCTPCAVGFYQNLTGQVFCFPCSADRTTTQAASTSSSACFEVCPDGTELIGSGTCQPCIIGYYRTQGLQDNCVQCPAGFVTPSTNSRTETDCSVPDCQAGEKINGTSCAKCPLATYQTQRWQTTCVPCSASQTTLQVGSTSPLDCRFFCPAGQEEYPSNSASCRRCLVGFYKVDATPGQSCLRCPNPNFVTASDGSTSSSQCTVLACNPGSAANAGKTACDPCPRGTYQQLANQENCTMCPTATSTREMGSNSSAMCVRYCADGEEEDSSGQCQPCQRGYYRNNTVYEYGPCDLCPADRITVATGASFETNCTVANCSAGSFLNNVNACELCPLGQYQPNKWQTSCISCDPNGQKTTDAPGAVSESQCRLECQKGLEDRGQNVCEQCPIGYYKDTVGAARCTLCPTQSITANTGSTAPGDCNIANCSAGSYRDTTTNQCVTCPRKTFEDRNWQINQCQSCPSGSTTLGTGKTSSADCVTDCPDGQQYDAATQQCTVCPRGSYRKKDLQDVCELCPAESITASVGAVFQAECVIRNCTAGTKLSTSQTSCIPCPKGEYQDIWWQTTCKTCNSGFTTIADGSMAASDCVLDCPLGFGYKALTGNCEICAKGEYKDATAVTCQACNNGLTTTGAGATSSAACNIVVCTVGQFPQNGTCALCPAGTYQDVPASTSCKNCGPDLTKVTSPAGASSLQQCSSTDECTNGQATCIPSSSGGLCTDSPGAGYSCSCRPGWTGTHPACVHRCNDTSYCMNGGICQGAGTDTVVCDCSNTNYEGTRCEALKTITTTTTQATVDRTAAIVGGAVGGGLGLLLLILIIACCCYAFRGGASQSKPPPPMPMVAPTVIGSMPSGTIVRPATRFGGSTLAPSMYASGAADGNPSLNGYTSNRYLFYDEGNEDGNMNGGYDPYEERTSTLLIS